MPRIRFAGSFASPASQCAPWIAHGTTCSSLQNAARRAPGSSDIRKPSSRSTCAPHHEQRSSRDVVAPSPTGIVLGMADDVRIIVLEGDETGQELLDQAIRLLDPSVTQVDVELEHYDLSLANRRKTDNEVVHTAARAMAEAGYGIKAATITPEGADDVGSPNRILREEIGGSVIIRTGRRIPGVTPVAGVHYPISVVRMAVGDAYGAKQWREEEDGDEIAYRTERILRDVCTAVAEHAFRTAKKIHGRVYGGPKWTVSPV